MNTTKSLVMAVVIAGIAACGASKKSTVSNVAPSPVPFPVSSPALPPLIASPNYGVPQPGNAELDSMRVRLHDISMQTLTEGYTLYTGTCTGCHPAINIYSRAEERWPAIITDMAQRASLSEAQKDAVYKYVLAVKSTQPK